MSDGGESQGGESGRVLRRTTKDIDLRAVVNTEELEIDFSDLDDLDLDISEL